MTYVMSDIHGQYGAFRQLLSRVRFSSADRLYILGDLCDRGPESAQLYLDVMERENVVCLMGNHEDMARKALLYLYRDPSVLGPVGEQNVAFWFCEGGEETYRSLFAADMTKEKRWKVLEFIRRRPLYASLEVNGQPYLLMHTVSDLFSKDYSINTYETQDFIWERPKDFNVTLGLKDQPENVRFLLGHTPTFTIGTRYPGIYFGKGNLTVLDCGAGFPEYGGRLGCLCLETGETYYSA